MSADRAGNLASDLAGFGWDAAFEAAFAAATNAATNGPAREAGRIVVEERGRYVVRVAGGEIQAYVSGRFRYDALEPADFPAVGDWVVLEPAPGDAIIRSVLPRRTVLVRRPPADYGAPIQVLAANIDTVFVVTSLDHDLKLRRLERYLAAVWESGARPVIVLSKADVAADLPAALVAVGSVAAGVDVVVVSALRGTGMDDVRTHLLEGRTVAVIGSSGVGKSTLINALLGEALLDTGGIREDDSRGRHTTTRRQLIRLERGLIVDTPGMRELALADDTGVDQTFGEIEAFASECRFSDCGHNAEPGCAVLGAIEAGTLSPERLEAYRTLGREGAHAARQHDPAARLAERRKWTAIHKNTARQMRAKDGDDQ